ncbi:MAG: hypothetical protein QNJ55_26915 [Xenococcus sp. MO_188.B8]|nr:hypothetical protein [Xenococcus sp. MO_188.B8]
MANHQGAGRIDPAQMSLRDFFFSLRPGQLWTLGGSIVTVIGTAFTIGVWTESNFSISSILPFFSNPVLIAEAPSELPDQIQQSREVWIVAQRGDQLLNKYYDDYLEVLNNRGTLNVILTNPDSEELLKYIGKQTSNPDTANDVRNDLQRSFNKLSDMAASTDDRSRIHTKVLDAVIPFAAVFCDPDLDTGNGYVIEYRYNEKLQRINLDKNKHSQWWAVFFPQVQKMWESGQDYQIQ